MDLKRSRRYRCGLFLFSFTRRSGGIERKILYLFPEKMNQIMLFLVIAFLCWAGTVAASMTESTLLFRNISAEHGLPHNEVSALFRDADGYLWIGTKEGLARFDGNRLLRQPETTGIDIRAIGSLRDDTLLLATTTGIRWFDTRSQTSGTVEEVPSVWFTSLCPVDSTAMLAGSEEGLYLIRHQSVHRIPIDNLLADSNHITGIRADASGNGFWFSTADGLGYLDDALHVTVYRRTSQGSHDNYFTCLTTVEGAVYVGSYHKGLFRFDLKTHTFTPIPTDQANLILCLDADADRLYVGTNGRGLILIDRLTGEMQCALHRNANSASIGSNVVTALLNDPQAIFVGAQFGGISYHSKRESHFSFYRNPQFASTDYNPRSLYFYPDGEMLLGTRSGLFQLQGERLVHAIETADFNAQMPSGIILYIGESNGRILVCSYGGGVRVYDRTTGQLFPFNEEEEYAQRGRIFQFISDRQGHLWFASHEGIYETDAQGRLLRHLSTHNSTLRNDAVYGLALDQDERLWIATKFGLRLLDTMTGKMTGALSCVPPDMDVRSIYRDSRNNMWVCGNRGVYCINRQLELVRAFQTDNLLPENIVTSVVEVSEGRLCFTMLHHILFYDLDSDCSEVYRSSDGFGLAEFNGTVVVHPASRRIYWTNEGGLLYTSFEQVLDHSGQPFLSEVTVLSEENRRSPRVTSIQQGDRLCSFPIDCTDPLVLTEGESIQFHFSQLDFRYPEQVCFEYQLEGRDEAWSLLNGASEVSYHALAPGSYLLKVRNPGQATVTELRVIVKRPTWKIVLFRLGSLIIACAILFLIFWIRKLYRRIAERTQIFSILHKKARSQVSAPFAEQSESQPVNPLMAQLLTLVEDEQIFLDPKLKISQVAERLGCRESELSRFLNAELSTNFTSFINTYRVKAVKRAMEEGELKRYTITAIGLRCGYNSKMTFFRAFKAIEGTTPLEYAKERGYPLKLEE